MVILIVQQNLHPQFRIRRILHTSHRLRYRSRQGYGTIKTILFSVSVTILVLTPTLTPNDPLRQNFSAKWHKHFKRTDTGNRNVYTN